MINDKFPFPDDWDRNNKRTVAYFNKCSKYVNSQEELLSLFHIKPYFYIYCYLMMVVIIISSILIIIYRESYIIKRSGPKLLLTFSVGCIINIANSFAIQVNYTNYPCFFVLYFSGISLPMIYISCIACFTKYINQYYVSANAYMEAIENLNENKIKIKKIEKNTNNFHLLLVIQLRITNIWKFLIEKHPVRFILCYVLIITIYSFSLSPFSDNYRIIGKVDKGFCTLSYEYIPQFVVVLSFLFFYVPYLLYVLRKIEDTFKIKNLIYITAIAMVIGIIGYLTSSLISKHDCSPALVRYMPTDGFLILCSSVFHILHVVKPLVELFYVKFSMRKIDKSMQGLKKVFKDKTLFREYVEFCKIECCVENSLYCKEYQIYKAAIRKYFKKINQEDDNSVKNTFIMDDQELIALCANYTTITFENYSEYSNRNIEEIDPEDGLSSISSSDSDNHNKKTSNTSTTKLLKMAQAIVDKYILPNAQYEINIDNKISNKILETIKKYKMINTNNFFFSENSELVTIFDDAYEEVLTNLYLNTYLKYVKQGIKKKKK